MLDGQLHNNTLFIPEIFPIGHDESGDVLDVTDLHTEKHVLFLTFKKISFDQL